eukprot:3152096-Rhodomonas_salina.2
MDAYLGSGYARVPGYLCRNVVAVFGNAGPGYPGTRVPGVWGQQAGVPEMRPGHMDVACPRVWGGGSMTRHAPTRSGGGNDASRVGIPTPRVSQG